MPSLLVGLFLAGAATGLLVSLFVAITNRVFRRVEWVALVISVGAAAVASMLIHAREAPLPTTLSYLAAIACGASLVVGAWNFVVLMEAGSGGFSSTRDNARILAAGGIAIAAVTINALIHAPAPPTGTPTPVATSSPQLH